MFIGGQVSKSVFIHLPFLYLVSIDKSQTVIGFLPGDCSVDIDQEMGQLEITVSTLTLSDLC